MEIGKNIYTLSQSKSVTEYSKFKSEAWHISFPSSGAAYFLIEKRDMIHALE